MLKGAKAWVLMPLLHWSAGGDQRATVMVCLLCCRAVTYHVCEYGMPCGWHQPGELALWGLLPLPLELPLLRPPER